MHAAVLRHGGEGRGGVRRPLHVAHAVAQVEGEQRRVRPGVVPQLLGLGWGGWGGVEGLV